MLININGQEVNVNQEQHDALTILMDSNLNGFACVHNYYPKSDWVVSPEQQVTFRAGVNQQRIDMLTLKALELLTLKSVNTDKVILSKGKDSFDTVAEQFKFCRDLKIAKLKEKMQVQAEGNYTLASGALNQHQIGKLKNNIAVANGVVANLVNAVDGVDNLDADGHKIPVLDAEGRATVESIVFTYTYAQTKTIKEGERKVVNSGSKVLMDKAIEKALPKNLSIRSCTLKDGAYLAIANQVIVNGLLEAEATDLKTLKA